MDLESKIRLNSLYDIYGELLTTKQKEYFEYYYLKDYSLSEISELLNVSRNAVHMQLKNVISHLENYEVKLRIMKTKGTLGNLIEKIETKDIDIEEIKKELEKI